MPDPASVVAEYQYHRVLLPAGPLLPGHLIITSRNHLQCFAGASQYQIAELRDVRTMIAAAVSDATGHSALFYEHGAPEDHQGHALHCGHAHQNALPLPHNLALLDRAVAEATPLCGAFTALPEKRVWEWYVSQPPVEYYYIGSNNRHFITVPGEIRLATTPRPFRRAFARILGMDETIAIGWEQFGRRAQGQPPEAQISRALRSLSKQKIGPSA